VYHVILLERTRDRSGSSMDFFWIKSTDPVIFDRPGFCLDPDQESCLGY